MSADFVKAVWQGPFTCELSGIRGAVEPGDEVEIPAAQVDDVHWRLSEASDADERAEFGETVESVGVDESQDAQAVQGVDAMGDAS